MSALLIELCAWCPDAEAKTDALIAEGYAVTHGMCPACSKQWDDFLARVAPATLSARGRGVATGEGVAR